MSKLPDKPSELIRVALADLAKCEADPTYEIDMNVWHKGAAIPTDTCLVCLAGAVMANSLRVAPTASVIPPAGGFESGDIGALFAIDSLRAGNVLAAVANLRLPMDAMNRVPRDEVEICEYETDPSEFRADMETLADELEANGL